jgi:stage II sporulation protein D
LTRSARLSVAVALALSLAGCAVRPTVPPPVSVPATIPMPRPAAVPTQGPAIEAPALEVPARADARPPLVRILLQTAPEPTLPDPGRRYACLIGDAGTLLRGPLTATVVAGEPGIQVGVFANEDNARAVLVRLNVAGFEGRVEPQGAALRRVVALGIKGEDADALARRLTNAGFGDQKRIATAYGAGLVVEGEGGRTLRAEVLRLVPIDLEPVRVGDKAVRGELELRPGLRGVLVINVINMEQYLRGVVPAEMGPRAFPNLEALKAQAVAARTYAVAHLGDHAAEGYDLCDSPACQVYEGAGAEQPLTDRAVLETAGEILTWHGRPIDAMYHSTCGGHTEDAAALFPDRAQPYLKGVPCQGESTLSVGEGTVTGRWLDAVERLTAVGNALAGALGVPREARALAARLTGRRPGAGTADLERAFGLEGIAATLHVSAGKGDDRVLDLLQTFRLPLPPPASGDAKRAWEVALVVRLGQLAGNLQAVAGRLLPGPQGIRLVCDGGESPHDLTGREVVLEKRGDRWRRGHVDFPPGSAATLWCTGTICPALEVEPLEPADAASAWSWWVRELPLGEIGKRLGLSGVREVRVLRRGVSGRALAVAVVTDKGATELPAMTFRRALDLPDTLFVAMSSHGSSGPSLRFLGRGWGHGVGMCQNGAYGLARGGESYVDILKTYYTGVEIAPWEGETP